VVAARRQPAPEAPLIVEFTSALRQYQSRRRSAREGGAPLFELESWLTSTVEAPRKICEIGLNAGESATAWLCAFPQATYVGFDLMQYNASIDAASWLKWAFPGRVRVVAGDTAVTLPQYVSTHAGSCDVLSIDGGHGFDIAYSDLSHFRRLARGERHVLLMDDLRCPHWWCKPPTAAWHVFAASGAVIERGCVISGCCVGWCWGQFNLSAAPPDVAGLCRSGSSAAARRRGSGNISERECIAKLSQVPPFRLLPRVERFVGR